MKKILLSFLLLATPAFAEDKPIVEQEKYELSCETGAVCLEQSLKNAKHGFHIMPGSVVRIEVKAKSGASITAVSGGNTMSASYLSVGNKQTDKQSVELEAPVDKTGNFTLDVQVAKVTVNGKPQVVDEGAYNLKITKVNVIKQDVPGEVI